MSAIHAVFGTLRSKRHSENFSCACYISMRIATLDDATEWTLSLAVARDGGAPVDITARVKFSEDVGYEPPQGRVVLQVVGAPSMVMFS